MNYLNLKILTIFTILLHLNLYFFADNATSNDLIRYGQEVGGVEFKLRGDDLTTPDDVFGRIPQPNSKSDIEKYKNGKLIYKALYTIDQYGLRISSASHLPGKTKHFFLIDGSVAFGEGLSDDSTIAHLINTRSKIYEAYSLGFLGYGPNHNWLLFKQDQLSKKIKQKKGSAIIITGDQDIRRFLGTYDHLLYASTSPYLVEKSPGEFEYRGNFKKNGSLMQRLISNICAPLIFCGQHLSYFYKKTDQSQIALAARVFASIEKMYREQFDVEDFTILWTGPDEYIPIWERYTKTKIIKFDFDKFDSSHPSVLGAKQIVDSLFLNKILH